MPRLAKELGALEVKRLCAPGYHHVGGVAGLIFQVSESGSKSWLLRIKVGYKRREIGLGAYPGVTLALAREKAQLLKDEVKSGVDPVAKRIKAKEAIVQEQLQEKALQWTFKACAEAYIAAKEPGWRNQKHGQQWRNTLATYVYPTMGNLLVRNVTLAHVMAVIEPHWFTKNETINRVRNRIELVLDWATVCSYRSGDCRSCS
jgi:hypothetical protein